MLQLTKKTDYSILALSYMAQRPNTVCTAREIAEQYHVPSALLMNVLKVLCQGELVRSLRGAKGGYCLARPADSITLADIIMTIEGPVRFVQCAAKPAEGKDACRMMGTCPVSRPVRKVHNQLNDFLKQVTLAQIAFDEDYGGRVAAFATKSKMAGTETVS
jgi:Rrf2 family protein